MHRASHIGLCGIMVLAMVAGFSCELWAQSVSISSDGTLPDSSAMLHVKSSNKGLLIPRMTEAQKLAIDDPARGLLVIQTTGVQGLYIHDSVAGDWKLLLDSSRVELNLSDVLANSGDAQGESAYNIGKLAIGGLPISDQLTIHGDTMNALTFELGDNTQSQGIAWQNKGLNYTWSMHRENVGGNDANLVISGGVKDPDLSNLPRIMTFTNDGLVGVGYTNPTRHLHVLDSTKTTAMIGVRGIGDATNYAGLALESDEVTDKIWQILHRKEIGNENSLYFEFFNGNTYNAPLIIDSAGDGGFTGNFSFGTSTPNVYPLYITRPNGDNSLVRNQTATGQIGYWWTNDAANWAWFSESSVGSLLPQGAMGLYGGNPAGVKMSLLEGGNLGLGIDSALRQMHLSRTADDAILFLETSSVSHEARLEFQKISSAFSAGIGFYPGNPNLRLRSSVGAIVFEPDSVEAMRITTAGYVGIANTSPSVELEVDGQIEAEQIGVNGDASSTIPLRVVASGTNLAIRMDRNTGAAGWEMFSGSDGLNFCESGVACNRLYLRNGGNVGIGVNPTHILHINGQGRSTSSSWATTSDIRVKDNVTDIDNALELIKKFRPVSFSWKPEFAAGKQGLKTINYGFISQEVEKILPEMVTEAEEIVGNDTISDFKVLDKDPLIALMLKAIQEQQILIEQLRGKVDQLENSIKSSKSKMHDLQSDANTAQVKETTTLLNPLNDQKIREEDE